MNKKNTEKSPYATVGITPIKAPSREEKTSSFSGKTTSDEDMRVKVKK